MLIIKSIDKQARLMTLGDDFSEWTYSIFFENQSEAELLELAHNIYNKFHQAADLPNIDKFVEKELPTLEEVKEVSRGEKDLLDIVKTDARKNN